MRGVESGGVMCAHCDRAALLYGAGSPIHAQHVAWYHPKPPPPAWRSIEWSAFCEWVQGRKVVEQRNERFEPDRDKVTLRFEDGAVAEVHSNYESDWSEVTPGEGIQPPTVRVLEGAKP